MRTHLTVVGAGLSGLVTAISAAEAGCDVTVYESKPRLGGRARTTTGPHLANWGPHVIYSDGPLWSWLDERGLARPAGRSPAVPRTCFRVDGRGRRLPPARVVRGLVKLRRREAPVDVTFREWATALVGSVRVAEQITALMGVATFDHDPGRLSAAFVQYLLRRATVLPPAVRYMPGGWTTMIERLAARARAIGVSIETSSPVDALPEPPVVLAVPLPRAAELLGDASLRWTGTRTALLDVAVTRRRADPFVLADLDSPGWAETFSVPDPSLAPEGEHLVQAQKGLRPGEDLSSGIARLEEFLDIGYPAWREREVWRRELKVTDDSGAVDLPGTSWRDRPPIERGDGVYVVGDMVAAPGLLSEVAHAAALRAVAHLTTRSALVS